MGYLQDLVVSLILSKTELHYCVALRIRQIISHLFQPH